MDTKEAMRKIIREKLSELPKKELLRLASMRNHVQAKSKRVNHKKN